jgi:hypothetical protein
MTPDPSDRLSRILTRLRNLKKLRAKATQGSITVMRYSHGGGRFYQEGNLIADFYQEGDREFYAEAANLTTPMVDGMIMMIEWLMADLQYAEEDNDSEGLAALEKRALVICNIFPEDV